MSMNTQRAPQKRNGRQGPRKVGAAFPRSHTWGLKTPKSTSTQDAAPGLPRGLIYKENWVSPKERQAMMDYLLSLWPLWENRFSKSNPPPEGQTQRSLLRPVYWLGNWQFACLNYYHPPKGIYNRCVTAEPYPEIMAYLVKKIEAIVQQTYDAKDIPRGWHLNTCLINYYGHKVENGKNLDCARVGEHKDFEPGPVASLSFGERAFFQFVASSGKDRQSQVAYQQWLEDSSLQIFGGDRFKKQLFHRVQRVDKKDGHLFKLNGIEDFETRRINLTFRYVPDEHIVNFHRLPENLQEDVNGYVETLSLHSDFFKAALDKK